MVKSGLRGLAFAGMAAVVAACGGASTTPPEPAVPAVEAPVPSPRPDRCGATEHQWLVGEPRTSIPVPVDVSHRRVTCTTCPMTEDYSENRLNILYDRENGLVERVFCG
jgi:hypothetical protein